MVITYGCSLLYMIMAGVEDPVLGPKGVRLLLVCRGITGFVGLFGSYVSLQYLSLSDATVLTFLSPLCTAAAGALLLNETFRLSQALAGAVSFVGVILIARPPFIFNHGGIPGDPLGMATSTFMTALGDEGSPPMRMIAVGFALVGVLGLSGAFIAIRAIGKRANALHVMCYYAMQCIIATTLGMIITKTPFIIPSRLEWFSLLLMIGFVGFVSQILLTLGLQRESAGRASMALYTQIVFATTLQFIFFHMTPSWLSILGTCLILSCALYVAMTKETTPNAETIKDPVRLDDGGYDHLESALHAPQATRSEIRS
ncbi:drug/metabolite transporter superfamily [Amanita muscaria]